METLTHVLVFVTGLVLGGLFVAASFEGRKG